MLHRSSTGAFALAAALIMSLGGVNAAEDPKYPNLKGQWVGVGAGLDAPWDPSKPPGIGQAAPLTAEYQAVYQAAGAGLEIFRSIAEVARGVWESRLPGRIVLE